MIPDKMQFDGGGADSSAGASIGASPVNQPAAAVVNHYMASANLGSGASSTPKTIDKSNWNKNIKVSQPTVDAVKDAGRGNMGINAGKAAISSGAKYNGSSLMPNQPASPQYKEATKRVYPGAINKATNQAASGRTNSPYGFGGFSQSSTSGGGGSTKRAK
jgi:hypothetical protein